MPIHQDHIVSVARHLLQPVDKLKEYILLVNPSTKYASWLLRQLKFRNIRLPEDSQRIIQLFCDFENFKSQLINKNIDSYERIHELEDIIEKVKDKNTQNFSNKQIVRNIKLEGTSVYKENEKYLVIRLLTPEAAAHYAKETRWCTSNVATAASYLERHGGLYIIFEKIDGKLVKLAQFTHNFTQVMNVLDQRYYFDTNLATLLLPRPNSEYSIKNALNYARLTKSEIPTFTLEVLTKYILRYNAHAVAYKQARKMKRRWPEVESVIAKNPRTAALYARFILKNRWPEKIEEKIAKTKHWFYYAKKFKITTTEEVCT